MLLANFEEETEKVKEITWNEIWNKIIDWSLSTGLKVLLAIILMVISFAIINFVSKRIYKRIKKKKVDATVSRFFFILIRFSLKLLVIICLVAYVGLETASFSAVIASLGVGVSLAVQGTFSNFAGGIMLVILRPFKLGDYITSNDYSGTVEDIRLFYTYIVTPDNKVVMIPNGSLANNVIVNYSTKETRRVEVIMSVSYNTNVELAKNLCLKVCSENPLILQEPKKPFVDVKEYGDSSINLVVRAWCKNADYWTINYYLLNEIKKAFDENNIEIPFNQLDVNLKNN